MKCSVPLGRFKMASRLMISEEAAAILGKLCERSSRMRRSVSMDMAGGGGVEG